MDTSSGVVEGSANEVRDGRVLKDSDSPMTKKKVIK